MRLRRVITVGFVLVMLVAGVEGSIAAQVVRAPGNPTVVVRDPAAAASPRQLPIGESSISGTVVAAVDNQPLASAVVTLIGLPEGAAAGPAADPSFARIVVSDRTGHFAFEALPAGQFTISVVRVQYMQTNFGATKPNRPGTLIQLANGQQLRISVPLVRGAVITGSVYRPDGLPLVNTQVRALRFTYVSGVKRLQSVALYGINTVTDDRGVYRMFGLPAGDYLVTATPASNGNLAQVERAAQEALAFQNGLAGAGRAETPGQTPRERTITLPPLPAANEITGYAPTYFPSATMPRGATTVHLDEGEERPGVDVFVQPVHVGRVTGTVVGAPDANTRVIVALVSDDPLEGDVLRTAAGTDGTFSIGNVPPGRYLVSAQTSPTLAAAEANLVARSSGNAAPSMPDRLWAYAAVTVDGISSPSATLALQPGRSISGTLMFDMAQRPNLAAMPLGVSLVPAPPVQAVPDLPRPSRALVGSDGHFTLTGVAPGRYFLRADPLTMKSATVNGGDALDEPVVIENADVTGATITMTDRASTLSGTLSESSGVGTFSYTVVVIPSDRRYWTAGSRRIATTKPATDGRFSFRNLPPGEYLLAAVTDVEPGGEFDPEFLTAVAAGALRVTISEGGRHAQDIRVAK